MHDDAWNGIRPSRRSVLFGSLMITASAAGFALKPGHRASRLVKGALAASIPTTIGQWSVRPAENFVLPPEEVDPLRVYDEILTRAYVNKAGATLMLLIAYGGGQTGLFQIHRPEACYPANGFTLGPRATVDVEVRDGQHVTSGFFTATAYRRTEQLLYWTRIGSWFPANWLQENIAVVRSNFSGQIPDGVIVRMSIISPDEDQSLALLRTFALELTQAAGPVGRQVMLGTRP